MLTPYAAKVVVFKQIGASPIVTTPTPCQYVLAVGLELIASANFLFCHKVHSLKSGKKDLQDHMIAWSCKFSCLRGKYRYGWKKVTFYVHETPLRFILIIFHHEDACFLQKKSTLKSSHTLNTSETHFFKFGVPTGSSRILFTFQKHKFSIVLELVLFFLLINH